MLNSASYEFDDPNVHVKDFDMLWLDDHIDQLVRGVGGMVDGGMVGVGWMR